MFYLFNFIIKRFRFIVFVKTINRRGISGKIFKKRDVTKNLAEFQKPIISYIN